MSYTTNLASYQTPDRQCIWLKGELERYEEDTAGASGIKPGHALDIYNSSGRKVRKQSVFGSKQALAIALEDSLQGLTIDDAYTTGDPVRYAIVKPGDEFQARVAAGAVAIVKCDLLTLAGDGTFAKALFAGSSLLYSNAAASAAVTNTVTATAFDKSYTIPANSLKVGDVIRIRAQVIATATHTTDTLVMTLLIGSTTIKATAAVDVADNDEGYIECDLVIRTIGASGTFVAAGTQALGVPGTVTAKPFLLASTAIDTTVTQLISVKATWSAADTGNSVRLDVLDIQRLAASGTGSTPVAMATTDLDNSAAIVEDFVDVMAI